MNQKYLSITMVLVAMAVVVSSSPVLAVPATWAYEGDVLMSAGTPAWAGNPDAITTLAVGPPTTAEFAAANMGATLPQTTSTTYTVEMRARIDDASLVTSQSGSVALFLSLEGTPLWTACFGAITTGGNNATDLRFNGGGWAVSADKVVELAYGVYHTVRVGVANINTGAGTYDYEVWVNGTSYAASTGAAIVVDTDQIVLVGTADGKNTTGLDYLRVVEGSLVGIGTSIDAVPEPATLALLGIGGLMMTVRRRRHGA